MTEIALKEVTTFEYDRRHIEKGYANQTLHVNISDADIAIKPVTEKMKEVFIGGKGFDLWLLWNAVKGTTKWNDPENEVCIASGPLGGTPIFPGSGKSIVTTISPITGSVMDSNVGGYFGPYLKFSGFDALEVQGKNMGDMVIFVDGIDQKVHIFVASGLPDEAYEISDILTRHFGEGKPRNISVVSTGPGAKNTLIGCLNFSWYDARRKRVRYKQAGRGGLGTVLRNKKIKAIVVNVDRFTGIENNPADPEKLASFEKRIAIALYNKGQFVSALKYFDSVFERWGVRFPKNMINLTIGLIYNLIGVVTHLYFPWRESLKTPSRRDNDIFDLHYKRGTALNYVDSLRCVWEVFRAVSKAFQLDLLP